MSWLYQPLLPAGAQQQGGGATQFTQSVTANVDLSVSITRTAGKIVTALVDLSVLISFAISIFVTPMVDVAVAISFAISHAVNVALDLSATVIKAITYQVANAFMDATAFVFKQASRDVTASITLAVGNITRTTGKLVTPLVDAAASVRKFLTFVVATAINAASSITTRTDRTGPLFRAARNGRPRIFWKGRR